jgi:hypothetical protein
LKGGGIFYDLNVIRALNQVIEEKKVSPGGGKGA